MGFTAYGRGLLLGNTFLGGTPPTTVWMALTVAVPLDSDDAAQLVEPVNAEYARVSYAVSGGFDQVVPGVLCNARAVQWATPTTDWGMVRGWAMCEDETAGLVIASGPFKQAKRVAAGVPVQLRGGSMRITSRS